MKIKFEGMDELQKKLEDNISLKEVRKIVKHNTSDLQEKAHDLAPVGTPESTGIKGYVGGHLRENIKLDIKDDGLTGEVESTAEYAAYVEFGTRYMSARPHMGPAYRDQARKFRQDMEKLTR